MHLGIDPGGSGGMALIVGHECECLKFDGATEHDIAEWLRARIGTISGAAIEIVSAMPEQGVSSTFKFGMSYGFLRGLLTAFAIPFIEVRPVAWMKLVGVTVGGKLSRTERKNRTKAAAQRMWPQAKITHANADALLIAEACRRYAMHADV